MSCGVYFIKSGAFIKIGYSADIPGRVRDLQRFNPERLDVLGIIALPSPDALRLERLLHRHFAAGRYRYEWFRESEAILDYIEEHARPLGGHHETCRDCGFGHASQSLCPREAACALAGLRPAAH